MSVVDAATRAAVEERASFRCEYCRLPTRGQIATFPIDHATPRSSGGMTELANLALACPHCNGHKWAHTTAPDRASGNNPPLSDLSSSAIHFKCKAWKMPASALVQS